MTYQYVPSAEPFGFSLRLYLPEMRQVLNSPEVRRVVSDEGSRVRADVEAHVRAAASPESADNYVAALFEEDSFSDAHGFDFDGPYSLGNRPVTIVGVDGGRGVNPAAKPPLMVEAETHALTSPAGVTVGRFTEDIR